MEKGESRETSNMNRGLSAVGWFSNGDGVGDGWEMGGAGSRAGAKCGGRAGGRTVTIQTG